ncbi:MAG: hypothetical protein Q8922_10225 [Bacteroidota bacterium]|nr:hypothetical protein [Bacteroidota bacterium]MDP4233927.1 hypothetical protein [Bacteroidota bacterium]MDP4242822.1 hypothetical protein [Bacteroidota bacterium]MDP4288300.1 hypothetical protein [Bacteroidota bacterium]
MPQPTSTTTSPYRLVLLICGLILIRFLYSLTSEFWFPDQDVLQIYLIGLKSFATHSYPYFGADLVYNGSQIPGALQGYVVSVGWYFWKIPEAPFIVLNVLLDLSLGFLAWYASKRLPDLSRVFIWCYVFLIPWSLCFFSRIVNPSYVIVGAILFFIAFFESHPTLRIGVMPQWPCFFLMGFAIFWIMQLHLSWVLLGPFTAVAFFYLLRTKNIRIILTGILAFLAGCLTTGSLLMPTLLTYGLAPASASGGQTQSTVGMVQVNFENAKDLFRILSIYFAYASFEVSRFIGAHTPERLQFLKDYWWAAPFTVFVALIGVAQLLFLVFRSIRPGRKDTMFRHVSHGVLSGLGILYASSLFSKVQVPAHGAVLLFPLVVLFALHAFHEPMRKQWIRRTMYTAFASATIMYGAIAWKNYTTISMYTNREPIVRALAQEDYTIVGRRRYEKEFDPKAVSLKP